MLAHRPGVPVSFDAVLTIVSFLVPILGAIPGLLLAASASSGSRGAAEEALLSHWRAVAGGAVVGAAIAAMHYTGMAAYRVEGIVVWNPSVIALSVALSMTISAAAFLLASTYAGQRVPRAAGGVFALAVLSLHFTGMAAVTITPLGTAGTEAAVEAQHAMALAVALAGLIVMTAGGFAFLLDRRSQTETVCRLTHLAMTDPLTGLPNRAAFAERLARGLERAAAVSAGAAVIAIDLDRFKEVNDTHGHAAGDAALRAIGQRLAAAVGAKACLARMGGDEFAALLPFRTRSGLDAVIARLEAAASAPVTIEDGSGGELTVTLGASFGIACFPEDGTDPGQLTNNADLALYRAKALPFTAHCFYDPSMDAAAREKRSLAAALREALASGGGLMLHYQLQASVTAGEITGYEALLRWRHPTRGMIPPCVFIPLAEEMGLIPALGGWVLRRACTEAAAWPHPWRVAVNVSPLQLADASLPGLVAEVLAETGLAAERLEIELTETAIVEDQERALSILRAIKALGVRVALDDFGTGYSSLKTLRSFPFDKIKLDRFFMAEIESSAEAMAVIRSVLALGKSLAIPVLAEGVERPEQLAILRAEGCDEAQGFLLGRPSPSVSSGPEPEAAVSAPRPPDAAPVSEAA